MTDFIVTITDPAELAGITWAREQYNASLPPPPVPPDTVMGGQAMPAPKPAPDLEATPQTQATLDTDDAYVQWVMQNAAASYAVQKEQAEWRAAYEESLLPPAQRRAPNGNTRRPATTAPRRQEPAAEPQRKVDASNS